MYWLTQLLKRKSGASDSLLDGIRFDTEGWALTKRSYDSLAWRNADGDTLSACVQTRSIITQSALSDFHSVRAFYRDEAIREGGGIICAEIVRVGGIRSVKVIKKYEHRPAYAYKGILIVPFKNTQYVATVDSVEGGVTGERDALVTAQLAARGELEFDSDARSGEPKKIKGWFQDPYDSHYQGSAMYSMSDDDRLDALFPRHPLSKIRNCLGRILDTLVIDYAILKDTALGTDGGEEQGRREASGQARRLLSSRTVGSLYIRFGASLLNTRRFDEAERLFAISISELERAIEVNDSDVAKHLFLLGLAYDSQGKYLDAESVLSRARSIFEQCLGDEDLHTAQATLNLARVFVSLGKHSEAEPLFLEVLRVFNEKSSSGSSAGVALNGLGLVRNARGLYLEAIPYFEQALSIFQQVHGPKFADCATVLRNMAFSLRQTGDDQRADEALSRARQIDS